MLRKYVLGEGIEKGGLELAGGSESGIQGSLLRGDRSGQRSQNLFVIPRKPCTLLAPGPGLELGFVLTPCPSGYSRNIVPCRGLVDSSSSDWSRATWDVGANL